MNRGGEGAVAPLEAWANVFGIKFRSFDEEGLDKSLAIELKHKVASEQELVRQAYKDLQKGRISQESYEQTENDAVTLIENLMRQYERKMNQGER